MPTPSPPVIITGLPPQALFIFLVQVSLLLGVARLLGEWMRTMKQPAVIGELLAGLVLGPSVLGWAFPHVHQWIFPAQQAQADLLSAVSWLGVLMLLIVTGLEVDLDVIARKAHTALGVSLGGVSVNFALGLLLGWSVPDAYLVHPQHRVIFSLFVAVAMSISAIPVIAKVLMDLDLIRRDIGQVILAAAMSDDSIGWIILSVVGGLAAKGVVGPEVVVKALASVTLFVGLGLAVGPRLVSRALRWVDDLFPGPGSQVSAILVMALGTAAFTSWLGIEAVLGAFVVGIVTARAPRLQTRTTHSLETITTCFLAPIFFASAGLKVNVWALLSPHVFLMTSIGFAVACLGKYVGCYIGGRIGGLSHWEGLAMGSGMNARGAMGIIVATLGLSQGVLQQETYSVLVAVSILTSLVAPPSLRWCLARVEIGEGEARRLAQEKKDEASFIRSVKRVLLPSRGGHNVQLAAQLMGHLSHRWPVEITALFAQVSEQGSADAVKPIQAQLQRTQGPQPQVRVVKGKTVLEVLVKEANKGYSLVVMGATEDFSESRAVVTPLVDRVLQGSPCATLIVKAHPDKSHGSLDIKRILVPTVGTNYSNHAVEMAAALGMSLGAAVSIVHVVPPVEGELLLGGQRNHELHREFGEQIVDAQADMARHLGAEVDTSVIEANVPEDVVIELAREQNYGLILMGTNLRPLMKRAFLGHRVETILREAPCAVAVLSSI